jgi:hypothetical protein
LALSYPLLKPADNELAAKTFGFFDRSLTVTLPSHYPVEFNSHGNVLLPCDERGVNSDGHGDFIAVSIGKTEMVHHFARLFRDGFEETGKRVVGEIQVVVEVEFDLENKEDEWLGDSCAYLIRKPNPGLLFLRIISQIEALAF